jgi:hypothetical protein
MKKHRISLVILASWGLLATPAWAIITNVVETGGDNEATDTITAKWTGTTFPVSVAGEPVPGLAIGENYTVGTFGHFAPAFVDRNHRYSDDITIGAAVPSYLVGGDYIMSGNDNRDNATYKIDVTINSVANVYMLIDNRLGGAGNGTPPTFGPTAMQWILDEGWIPTNNGLNRTADPNVPDEVAIDEGADGGINQWYSVYTKTFNAGTFSLLQADNAGQNMYGVVVASGALPGDVDEDNDVDMTDFDAIRNNFQKSVTMRSQGDLNGDGIVDFRDFRQWKDFFPTPVGPTAGAVPEPASGAMGLVAAAIGAALARSRRRANRS